MRILNYQNYENAYNLGLAAILRSNNEMVMLQSLILMESSIMKDWENYLIDDFNRIFNNLFEIFNSLSTRFEFKTALARLCNLLSKILKRAHAFYFYEKLTGIYTNLVRLVEAGDNVTLENGFLLLMYSIIQEYSEVKSSMVYITFEDMINIRNEFEDKILFNILELCVKICFNRFCALDLNDQTHVYYIKNTLRTIDVIFNWRFKVRKTNFKLIWFGEDNFTFDPPQKWLEFLKKHDLCNILYYVFQNFYNDFNIQSTIESIFLQYYSVNFGVEDIQFIKSHLDSFLNLTLKITQYLSSCSFILCICTGLKRLLDPKNDGKVLKEYYSCVITCLIDKKDYLVRLAQIVAANIDHEDSACEYFLFIHAFRNIVDIYSFYNENINEFFKSIEGLGHFFIESKLYSPLGNLGRNNLEIMDLDNIDDNLWFSQYTANLDYNLSYFLSGKLKKCADEISKILFTDLGEYNFLASNIIVLTKIFLKGLIDQSSDCFMDDGIKYIYRNPEDFLTYTNTYFEWHFNKIYTRSPCTPGSIFTGKNGHFMFFIYIMCIWQILIERVKISKDERFFTLFEVILDFIENFCLYFEPITPMVYNNGELIIAEDSQEIKFILENDRDRITNIIFENTVFLFNFFHYNSNLNDQCVKLIQRVFTSLYKFCLFDSQWTLNSTTLFLDIFNNVINNPTAINIKFAENITSILIESVTYCRLPDSNFKLIENITKIIENKFSKDSNDFPATGFQNNECQILKSTWNFNLAVAEGCFRKVSVPRNYAAKYPLLIGSIFQAINKILTGILVKGGKNDYFILKYIIINKEFFSKFRYYSAEKINIVQHLDNFEIVSNTYFIYVKNHVPPTDRIEALKESKNIMKIFRALAAFCIQLIHISDSVKYNGSKNYALKANSSLAVQKIFSISKSILFNLLVNSNEDFLMIPKFSDCIFDAISEFCRQFHEKILVLNHIDISFLIKFICIGVNSDCVDRKNDLFESLSKFINSINNKKSNYRSEIQPNLLNPLIETLLQIMINEPISLDLLDSFCNTFLHILKWYRIVVIDHIQNYLDKNQASDFIKSKVSNVFEVLIWSLDNISVKKSEYDTSQVSHHFLNLISILRSLHNRMVPE